MAGLLPLIQELLPMIMPSSVHISRGVELSRAAPGESDGEDRPARRRDAIVGKSDRICASVITVKPHSSSTVHHHSEQDTIIYASSGTGILVTNPGGAADEESGEVRLKRQDVAAGDFVFVPPWTEHQTVNETDADVVWVIIQSGPEPIVVDLVHWGEAEMTG